MNNIEPKPHVLHAISADPAALFRPNPHRHLAPSTGLIPFGCCARRQEGRRETMPQHDMTDWRRRCKQAHRVRGYRIRAWYQGQYGASDSPTLWAAEPIIPPEWEATKHDLHVVKAILF